MNSDSNTNYDRPQIGSPQKTQLKSYYNGLYTWNNKRLSSHYIAERLDRFIFKGDLSNFNYATHSTILPNVGSHPFLVRLDIEEQVKPIRNPFKCEKMLFLDDKFMGNIKQWWTKCEFEESKIFRSISKLKYLKENILRFKNTSTILF